MDFKELYKSYLSKLDSLQLQRTNHVILASIKNQKLYLVQDNQIVNEFLMSTSKKKPSCIEDSLELHGDCMKYAKKSEMMSLWEWFSKGEKQRVKFFLNVLLKNNNVILLLHDILRLKGLELGINLGTSAEF